MDGRLRRQASGGDSDTSAGQSKQDRHLTVGRRHGAAIDDNSKHTTVHVPKSAARSTAATWRLATPDFSRKEPEQDVS